jgi:hypothetical protein
MGFFARLFGDKGAPVALKPGRGWVVEVVGESQYQDALARSYKRHGGDGHDLKVTASLRPESGNANDEAAVRVEIDGATVGYLPREIAPDYRVVLGEQAATCSAKIVGGFTKEDGTQAFFGVKLNAKWPPAPIEN